MTKHEPEVRNISRDELIHKMHGSEPFILVNVLEHKQFLEARLPGSINVPLVVLHDLAPILFGKDDDIIVYCSNFDCTASSTAAKILMRHGFSNVLDYAGGVLDWMDGGLPIMSEEPASH